MLFVLNPLCADVWLFQDTAGAQNVTGSFMVTFDLNYAQTSQDQWGKNEQPCILHTDEQTTRTAFK